MSQGTINCPQCGHEFELSDALTHQIREHMKTELQADVVKREAEAKRKLDEVKAKEEALAKAKDSLSEEVEKQLKLKLTSSDRRRLASAHTKNPEAYELYLKGRYHFGKWTEAGFREAKACYERALGSDPSFALAYSGLGEVFCVQSYFSSDPAQVRTATSRS